MDLQYLIETAVDMAHHPDTPIMTQMKQQAIHPNKFITIIITTTIIIIIIIVIIVIIILLGLFSKD